MVKTSHWDGWSGDAGACLEISEKPSTRKLVPADSARHRSRSDGLAVWVSRIQASAVVVSGAAKDSSRGNDLLRAFDAGIAGMYAVA